MEDKILCVTSAQKYKSLVGLWNLKVCYIHYADSFLKGNSIMLSVFSKNPSKKGLYCRVQPSIQVPQPHEIYDPEDRVVFKVFVMKFVKSLCRKSLKDNDHTVLQFRKTTLLCR